VLTFLRAAFSLDFPRRSQRLVTGFPWAAARGIGKAPDVNLESIGPEIWIADGAPVPFLGFPYPTRMTVVRLPDSALWVCSPIRLTDALAAEVALLGDVRELVSPNKIHHLFLAEWKRRWPQARMHAAPGLARRRRDLAFDGELGDAPDPVWAGSIDQVIFHGSLAMEEVVFFHLASRTAIVTDLIQRFDPAAMGGWRGWLMRLDGLVGPDGSTPREWRASFLDRRAARRAREQVLGWNPERVVIAHGDWIRANGREAIARALRWMGRNGAS